MENSTAQETDNGSAQNTATTTTTANAGQTTANATQPATMWKGALNADMRGALEAKQFSDDSKGLSDMVSSYLNLEKLLGHEKVPIPKGPEDTAGWNVFSKAMGIPDRAEGYGLPDASLPESMKGMTIDKGKFAEVAHAHKLTPNQTQGLWKVYNEINISAYNKAMEDHKANLTNAINTLRGEWGDTYEANVNLGQTVINKFAPDKEANDFLTSVLTQNPVGIKFLASLGKQFAENKIGEFQMHQFSLAPEEAKEEMEKMRKDLDGPYMNQTGKHTDREHKAAIDRMNHLQMIVARAAKG